MSAVVGNVLVIKTSNRPAFSVRMLIWTFESAWYWWLAGRRLRRRNMTQEREDDVGQAPSHRYGRKPLGVREKNGEEGLRGYRRG